MVCIDLQTWVNDESGADGYDPQNRYPKGSVLLQMHHRTGVVEFRKARLSPYRARNCTSPAERMTTTLHPHTARLAGALLLLAAANVLIAEREFTNAAALPQVQLLGAPTRYAVDVERYRFGAPPDVRTPNFYPIPRDAVSRETYLRCIDELNPSEIARHPNRGMDGPQAFMPVLAKYVQTGDSTWAEACGAMLRAFHAEMLRQVAERK